MEIKKFVKEDYTELKIEGRLDAYWADHLSKEMDLTIREGSHHLILDLSDLEYISSAGIGILIKYDIILSEMNGSFSVSLISEPVKKVLDLIGLDEVLGNSKNPTVEQRETPDVRQYERHGTNFKIYVEEMKKSTPVECRLIGDPNLLKGAQFGEANSCTISIPASWHGVGLGCLGNNFDECQHRFGEFITTSGITAYLPTDGTNVPDYMIASGSFVPELCLLYGLFFNGDFSHFIRFDVQMEKKSIHFSHLVREILHVLDIPRAAVTMLVENEGLVGTALRAAPVHNTEADIPFKHPEVRKWLSFTSERAYQQNNALITGIVDSSPEEKLQPFIRPLDSQSDLFGHFHASVFPYHPIKIGRLTVNQATKQLYEMDSLQSVLHLINDDREISGVGESDFKRGACWIAPISSFLND